VGRRAAGPLPTGAMLALRAGAAAGILQRRRAGTTARRTADRPPGASPP